MAEGSEAIVARLRQDLRRWGGADASEPAVVISTGARELDDALPDRGIRRGSLVEWIGESGSGRETLALAVANRSAETESGAVVVIDRERTFFPVAAAGLGIDLASLVVVRPRSERDALWAFYEVLGSRSASVVWGRAERMPGRAYRQLQLTAEESGTIGFLSRSPRTLNEPAWCDAAIQVEAIPCGLGKRSFRVNVLRHRHGASPQPLAISLRDDGRPVAA